MDETAISRLHELAARVRREIEALAYPNVDWVRPIAHPSGQHVFDVAIIGGGQSGLGIAFALQRDGISNILVLDAAPEGQEGPWAGFARMDKLRTPRFLVGIENGLPALSTRAWYEARYSAQAWLAVDRLPREDWMAYLRWFRATLGLPVHNNTRLLGIAPDGHLLRLRVAAPDGARDMLARRVVLATGYDGAGQWTIPAELRAAIPAEFCCHSNGPIDFAALAGKRVGVLGHGASAFDAALAALRHGAARVDLCFRRASLPRVNPHRWIEFAGFLKHFPELEDAQRWAVNWHIDAVDQPPARHSFDAALAFPNFAVHPACPWTAPLFTGTEIQVQTPHGPMAFDFVVAATGSRVGLHTRPELAEIASDIALWQQLYTPPPEATHPFLGEYPYLGAHYEFLPAPGREAAWLRQIYAFNFAAILSMGPHSTSISGHKYSIPRVVRGITSSLFAEQSASLLPGLCAYEEVELELPVRDGAPASALFRG